MDSEGNVAVDYSGFVGGECAAEEESVNRRLAEFGLIARPMSKSPKNPTPRV